MRYSGRGTWFAFAMALALFVVSGRSANAESAEIGIKGGTKESTNDKKKPKPIEVEKGKGVTLEVTTKTKGDCGTCTIGGQLLLIHNGQVVKGEQIPPQAAKDKMEIPLGESPLVSGAEVGDTIVVILTITCVKDNVVVCSGQDTATLKIVAPKK